MATMPVQHADGVKYVKTDKKNTNIFTYLNAASIVLDVGFIPDAGNFGCAVLFNSNMHTSVMFAIEAAERTPDVIFGDITYTMSRNGSVITLTPSSKLWGASMVVYSANNL